MGQRHQLFIIAQLRHKDATEKSYRCVVAAHHQWLYGMTALAACKAFLDLVRNVDNANIVKAELAAIEASHSRSDTLPQYSAPFLSWMLFAALTLRCEDNYESSRATLLDPNMGSRQGDNNDGITVFDVTDPLHPSYCLVSIHRLEVAKCNPEMLRTLSAEQYVRAYYPVPQVHGETTPELDETESFVVKHIDNFKDEKLIEQWMLHEAWPHEGYGAGVPKISAKVDSATDPHFPTAVTIPTLTEISLRTAITTAEKTGDMSHLEIAMSLPGVGASLMLTKVAEYDHFSDEMFNIVLKCFREDPSRDQDALDLSPYAFTSDQVVDTARCFPSTKVLNLSGKPNVNLDALSRLLPNLPALSRLNVYNCESLELEDILSVRSKTPRLEVIYHRSLMMDTLLRLGTHAEDERFKRRIRKHSVHLKPSFTFYFRNAWSLALNKRPAGCSLVAYSPQQVVTSLCDFHDYLLWSESFYDEGEAVNVIFSGLSRKPNMKYKERILGNLPEKLEVAQEGWLYAVVPQESASLDPSSMLYYSWGFVKYSFSERENGGVKGNPDVEDSRWTLQDVKVVGLADWLDQVDPNHLVEKEWRGRLEDKLTGSESFTLLSEKGARELLKTIPQFVETSA